MYVSNWVNTHVDTESDDPIKKRFFVECPKTCVNSNKICSLAFHFPKLLHWNVGFLPITKKEADYVNNSVIMTMKYLIKE